MILTATERESVLWKKVVEHLQERMEKHRKDNDSWTLPEIETARLRGRIAETKYWLGLNVPEESPGDK